MLELFQVGVAAFIWLAPLIVMVGILNKRFGRKPASLTALLAAFPAYYFLQIVLAKLLDVGGILNSNTVTVLYLLAVAAGLVLYRRQTAQVDSDSHETSLSESDNISRRIALLCAGVVVTVLLIYSLVTPLHVWDVLAYHMPMVGNYVQNGSLSSWPTQELRQVLRVNGAELQMLNLALLSRSDAWMELPNILTLLVSLIAVREMGRLILRREDLSYLAVVVVLTAPQILFGSVTAKNDVVFMAVTLCGLYWLIRSRKDSSSHVFAAVMTALCAGLAVATKVIGLNVVAVLTIGFVVWLGFKQISFRAFAVFCLSSAVLALVLVGDVFWNNFVNQGASPIGIVPGEVQFTFGIGNFIAAVKLYVYELCFKRLLLPQTADHDFSHFGYFFPLLLAFGVLASIRQFRSFETLRKGDALPMIAMLAFVLFLTAIVARIPIRWDQRFMIWMVPVFGLLAVSTAMSYRPRIILVSISFCAAFAVGNVIALITNSYDGIFLKSASHLVETRHLPRLVDVSLTEATIKTAGFDVRTKILGFDALDRLASSSDSVLYVGAEDTWMYPAWGPRFTRHVTGVASPEDARRKAGSGEYRFIVIEDDASPMLRSAAQQGVSTLRYETVANEWGRTIYRRTDPQQ